MSHYKVIEGIRYDRKILETVDKKIVKDAHPFITLQLAQEILPLTKDEREITPTEKRSFYYLLSTYQWENEAEQWLRTQLEEPLQESLDESVNRIVVRQFGLKGLQLDLGEEEIQAQHKLVEMGLPFSKALEKAVRFLADGKFSPTPFLTPREAIRNIYQLWEEDEKTRQQLNEKLHSLLNHGSRVKLLPWLPEMDAMEDPNEREEYLATLSDEVDIIYPTEMESVKDYWIFYLTIEKLSYFGWILIDRESIVAPYIYGDNF